MYIDKMGSSIRITHMHENKPATHSPETVEMWLIVCVYTIHTNIPGSEEPVWLLWFWTDQYFKL